MRFVLLAALASTSMLMSSGCDSANGEEQQIFETTALLGASDGATADDWRVGPGFAGRATVSDQDRDAPGVQGATPNPARRNSAQIVTVQVSSTFDSLGRVALYRREDNGNLQIIEERAGVNGPQDYTFAFTAAEASLSTAASTARLVVLDGLGRVITYGDLVLN